VPNRLPGELARARRSKLSGESGLQRQDLVDRPGQPAKVGLPHELALAGRDAVATIDTPGEPDPGTL
jgi:hypothetical protein